MEVLQLDTGQSSILRRESMRMMPVSADDTFRVNATDLKVGPHSIPAGKLATAPSMAK